MSESEVYHDPYHITVMRSQLPRKIGSLYPELRDEIIIAFDEVLDLNDSGNVLPVTSDNNGLLTDIG